MPPAFRVPAFAASWVQANGLGGDPQGDSHNDDPGNQRAEQIALMYSHCHRYEEADGQSPNGRTRCGPRRR